MRVKSWKIESLTLGPWLIEPQYTHLIENSTTMENHIVEEHLTT